MKSKIVFFIALWVIIITIATIPATTAANTKVKATTFTTTTTTITTEPTTTTTTIVTTTTTIPEKYPAAAELWRLMKSQGWNDIVCAGIMGNFMAEVGGQTLNILWEIHSPEAIGICQWMGQRKVRLIEKYGNSPTCKEQIDFMVEELYGTNGNIRQISEEEFRKIMYSDTPEEVAYYFAKYFERCSTRSYNARKTNARKAYEYFVTEKAYTNE